jgi:3-hydroxyisobutyrate dehydrogenase-like beta-hydroxyacid dehydrogenase
MKLGFIGFGEVGYELSSGFKKEGLSGIVAYDIVQDDPKLGALVRSRAKDADVQLLPNWQEVVKYATVIIAAVPGANAFDAALEGVKTLDSTKIYVDVSTSSPKTKKKINEIVHKTGARFVDGAMMGMLIMTQHKVPTLLSGNGTDEFISRMTPYNMKLTKISDTPGDAIGIKLVRSIYMKGMSALSVEMLEAAAKLQVERRVLDSVSDSLNARPFEEVMTFLVTAGSIHAKRQAHEMEDVRSMLEELEIEPIMTIATKKRLNWLASKNIREKFQGKRPETWEQIIKAFDE